VNYYVKHLLVDADGNFTKTLGWVVKAKDPKIVCHPVLVILSDTVWAQVACRTFLLRKVWFSFTLCVFIASQSVLSKWRKTEAIRITIFSARCFIYAFSYGGMCVNHARKCITSYGRGDVFKVMKVIPVPKYLGSWQEFGNLILMICLIGMICTEPILYCVPHAGEELFTDTCEQAHDERVLFADVHALNVPIFSSPR